MADVIKGEMIRGQIDTVILLALTDGDKDSNDIRIAIEEKSDNQYSIKQGTFYSAMQRLVKQGLIKEYRSSALDGIRRKYYSLTPKGTKYLDKNREQWSISKALVDNLIDAEPTQVEIKPEKPAVEIVDEFDSFKALVEKSSEDFTLNTNDTDESYFDVLGASVLSDLNAELEKAEAENETNNSPTTTPQIEDEKPLNVQVEDEKLDIIEEKSSDFIDDYLSLSNKTKEELFSFELDDEEDAFALQEDIDQVEQ
ncbi:MAG: PadR family transcriptional regulator [Clostridia bacterium]|nr:PadR family transcriptional regulator [Clostridia bacterium]